MGSGLTDNKRADGSVLAASQSCFMYYSDHDDGKSLIQIKALFHQLTRSQTVDKLL